MSITQNLIELFDKPMRLVFIKVEKKTKFRCHRFEHNSKCRKQGWRARRDTLNIFRSSRACATYKTESLYARKYTDTRNNNTTEI